LNPATIPGHKTPQQPVTKAPVKPKGTDKDKNRAISGPLRL